MKKYLIITTVGTSLFTNYTKEEVKNDFDEYIPSDFKEWEKKNLTAKDYGQPGNDFSSMECIVEKNWLQGRNKIGQHWIPEEGVANRHASAEITSILEIAEKIKSEHADAEIEVKLLATDTALSVSAARLISEFPFDDQSDTQIQAFSTTEDYIPSLGVHPPEDENKKQYYDKGLQQLVEKLIGKEGLIKIAKQGKTNPVINFSGGYKAIIPFLTIIAQLENIPMYYIYEDSDYLMELGSLPVNFDWAVIEALKPLLKKYIFDGKLNALAPYIGRQLAEYKDGSYFLKQDDENGKIDLNNISLITHQAVHGLLAYKLIAPKYSNSWKFDFTPLGKIISNVQLSYEDDRGYIMEHLIYKLFSTNHDDRLIDQYQTHPIPSDLPFGFCVKDQKKALIELVQAKPKSKSDSIKEIGDIDVFLKRNKTAVWAESKAYSTAGNYHSYIEKKEDYYFQLKARALALEKHFDSVELLFIVFRFVFSGLNDNSFLGSLHFKKGLARFEELNRDEDIKSFTTFRCIGITIPVDFDKDRINFIPVYDGRFNNWTFEELKTSDHA